MSVSNEIIKAIKSVVNEELSNSSFDKTRTGIVLKLNKNNTYMVKIDSQIYPSIPIINKHFALVGDTVKVTYPSGNSSQMYISSGRYEVYDVGDVVCTFDNSDPKTRFGGEWKKIEGRFLLGANQDYEINTTGGSADAIVPLHTHPQVAHTHTVAQAGGHVHSVKTQSDYAAAGSKMGIYSSADHTWAGNTIMNSSGEHTHSVTGGATTTGQASDSVSVTGKNMPPYIGVYIWERIQ